MVRIDRRTGTRVFEGWPENGPTDAVIWEAFKPDTEPRRTQRQDEIDAMRNLVLAELRRRAGGVQTDAPLGVDEPENFVEEQGGIY